MLQQLIKNLFLSNSRTVRRKIQELMLTRSLYRNLHDEVEKTGVIDDKDKRDYLVKKKILEITTLKKV